MAKHVGRFVGVSIGAVVILSVGLFWAVQQPAKAETPPAAAELARQVSRTSGTSVAVVRPVSKKVSKGFSVMGAVKADSEVTVTAETGGKILKNPGEEGMTVDEGTVLAVLDQETRKAVHDGAAAALEKADRDLARAKELYEGNMLSFAEFDQAKVVQANCKTQEVLARKDLEAATIRSPISGRVAEMYTVRGGQVAPGTAVALVIDPSVLKVRVLLPETSALALKEGDKAGISTPVFPGRNYSARVSKVGIRGDATNAFPVELILDDSCRRDFRVGMSVQVLFSQVAVRDGLMIPRVAVLGSTRDAEVFRVVDGKAVRTKVSTGDESETDIEVLGGLVPQDQVVVAGQNLLTDGQPVQVSQ